MEDRNNLELRMYFLVPYQLTGIQQGIQAGHVVVEYAREFSDTDLFKRFADNWKTFMIMNGGTTRTGGSPEGDLQISCGLINDYNQAAKASQKVTKAVFHEPDLNNALTAVCFIVEEPSFNYDDYIDLAPFAKKILPTDDWKPYFNKFSYDELKIEMPFIYEEWEKTMGGPRNVFLRELLKGKRFA